MPARWVIHTVGPVYSTREDRSATLRSCYASSLAVADEIGAHSVAFPMVSAGVYGWPMDDAVLQAVTAVRAADTQVERVLLVAFGEAAATALRSALG